MRYSFKTAPDPYQRDALIAALKHKRYGVFFQQRIGKTKVAIDFIGALAVAKGITRVLVTCPVIGIGVWGLQLKEHAPYAYTVKTLPTTETGRTKLAKEKAKTVTILCVTHGSLNGAKKFLHTWKPDVVIADEVHCFKDPGSKRSKALYQLTKECPYVLGLTGTPIPKRPLDVFGIWKIIDPTVFGISLPKFRDTYCIMGGYMGKEVVGYKDKPKLARLIAQKSTRVLRKDVLDEPNEERVIVPIKLEPQARKQYDALRKTFVAELEAEKRITADIAAVRATRLQQFCGGFIPADHPDPDIRDMVRVSYAKEKGLMELLESLREEGEKAIVFCRFTAEIEALSQAMKNRKIPHFVMTGATPGELRTKLVATFQEDPIPVVMLMQEVVGSMSICLDTARTNIYYSMTFSLVDFQQSRDRIMGRGQKNDVTNYFLAVEDSADYKVMNTLKNDEDLASEIGDKYTWLLT